MAHYAKLDENNNVIDCIVIADKDCLDENGVECEESGRRLCEALSGHANWKKTSFNTRLGIHYNANTGEPSEDQSKAFRLNYGGLGMKYDENLDAFITLGGKTYLDKSRLALNPKTGDWSLLKPNIPHPEDLQLEQYPLHEYQEPWFWNEHQQNWEKLRIDEVPNGLQFKNEEMI